MDAFAVALTQGARFRPSVRGGFAIALTFGAFQAVMPLIGWKIGTVAFVAAGIDAGSWRWSLRHPHLEPTVTPLATGTMPTRKEAAHELLACWQAWYRKGDEGGEP